MLRYALYARKSKEDNSGLVKSIQDQLAVWRDLARVQGLTVAAEFEENRSARLPGQRPVYARMLAALHRGELDGILVWHVNRLARNMEEAGALAQMLIDGRIKEIRTPHWTYKPGDNILPLLLEQGMSAQYSLDLAEAVSRGMASVVEAGGWPHQAKLGYLNARDPANPKRGIIVKDPARFALTRRGFELMLTGGYSVRQAVDEMNRWGLQTRPTPTRPGGPLSYALGYDIFTNQFYAGFTRCKGVLRRGVHPPMLTVSEYESLQRVVERRGHFAARRRPRLVFAYTGLMRCGHCGRQVTAERHYKSGRWRVYYHCSDAANTCTKRGITEEALEGAILARLDGLAVDRELGALAWERLTVWLGGQGAGAAQVLASQRERLAEVDAQRGRLLNMLLGGVLTDEALYREKDAALLRERNGLAVAVQTSAEEEAHLRAQARAALDFAERGRVAFLMGDVQRRKEIARALGAEYVLRGRELTLTVAPVLEEMRRYVAVLERETRADGPGGGGENGREFEPGEDGSQSGEQAFFSESCRVGR